MDIREEIAKIGKNYVYAVDKQEKEYKRYKTGENEAILYIYELMLKMIEKVSQEPDMEVFIYYGKKIKTMAKETGINITNVIEDLKKINRLLK